jgi:hypothetical protein
MPANSRIFHSLKVHISPSMKGRSVRPKWTITDDNTAAIYTGGFQAFLNAPDDLAAVKAELGIQV